MSLGTLQGVASPAGLVAGVSLVSTLPAGDGAKVSSPAGHYFQLFITTTDWHKDPVQHAALGLSD